MHRHTVQSTQTGRQIDPTSTDRLTDTRNRRTAQRTDRQTVNGGRHASKQRQANLGKRRQTSYTVLTNRHHIQYWQTDIIYSTIRQTSDTILTDITHNTGRQTYSTSRQTLSTVLADRHHTQY